MTIKNKFFLFVVRVSFVYQVGQFFAQQYISNVDIFSRPAFAVGPGKKITGVRIPLSVVLISSNDKLKAPNGMVTDEWISVKSAKESGRGPC